MRTLGALDPLHYTAFQRRVAVLPFRGGVLHHVKQIVYIPLDTAVDIFLHDPDERLWKLEMYDLEYTGKPDKFN